MAAELAHRLGDSCAASCVWLKLFRLLGESVAGNSSMPRRLREEGNSRSRLDMSSSFCYRSYRRRREKKRLFRRHGGEMRIGTSSLKSAGRGDKATHAAAGDDCRRIILRRGGACFIAVIAALYV